MKYIFCGNPGTGKSTLLNAFVGGAHFKSGVSIGQGLTYQFDKYEKDGITYCDTPGLSDVKMRQVAAESITKALKSGDDDYKIIFVVTQEAGRVRPADISTIEIVMESLSSINGKPAFAIIVNKVPPKEMKLFQVKDKYEKLKVHLNSAKYCTNQIFLYARNDDLESEDNMVHEPSDELKKFVKDVYTIYVPVDNVSDVNVTDYDGKTDKLEKFIQELKEDNEKFQQRLETIQKQAPTGSIFERALDGMAKGLMRGIGGAFG